MVVCPIESVNKVVVVEQKDRDHEADASMARGKRHMICGEVQEAIDSFSEACEMLSTKYGQMSEKLATPYLYYGKALLKMARIENGVLGHAVKGSDAAFVEKDKVESLEDETAGEENKSTVQIENVELSEDKVKEIHDEVQDAMRGNNVYNDQMTEDEATEDEEDQVAANEQKSPAKELPSKQSKADSTSSKPDADDEAMEEDEPMDKCEEGGEVPASNDTEPEEDVTSMQLAWEMLELAFKIFTQVGCEACFKQAECKHLLGEVSMEKGDYTQAVGDFIESYELQKKGGRKESDRRMAESCYSVGLGYSFDNKFSESITWYRRAVTSLEARTTHLEEKLKQLACEEYGEPNHSEMYHCIEKECDELKDLVVLDMRAKIEDVELSQKHYTDSINVMKTYGKDVFPGAHQNHFDQEMSSNAAATVSQIDPTKIQKKRKSVNTDETAALEAKKKKNSTSETAPPRAEQCA